MDVLTQCKVNEALVVSATRCVNLLTKPCQNVIVNPNGDPSLTARHRCNPSALTFTEIVLCSHTLTLILATLSSRRPPRRDNPDALSAPCVDNYQDTAECVHSDCDESRFLMTLVWNGDRIRVLKDADCIREIDAMLLAIQLGLSVVPIRNPSPDCMHKRTAPQANSQDCFRRLAQSRSSARSLALASICGKLPCKRPIR
jgi:hypothetical protein